jgi:predicted membrane protein
MKSYDDRHMHRHGHNGNSRFVLGGLIILAGILLVMKNLGALPWQISDIVFSWQMLLIVIGIINISRRNHFVPGVILIAIGSYFLIPEFTNTPELFSKFFWGGILMLLGVMIILRTLSYKGMRHTAFTDGDSHDYVDEISIFGGSEKRMTTKNFRGGKITSIFGGSTIDFTDSKLAEGQNELDVMSLFGGFKIIVPVDWTIKIEAMSILGGISDKRNRYTDDSSGKLLIIKGIALFGGGEIKNY